MIGQFLTNRMLDCPKEDLSYYLLSMPNNFYETNKDIWHNVNVVYSSCSVHTSTSLLLIHLVCGGGRVRVGGEGVEIDATTYMVEIERQTRGMVD